MESGEAPKKCPVCEAYSRSGTLLLRQINATEAIYVCDNAKCPYPVGSANLETVLVQRPIPELINQEDSKVAGNTHVTVDGEHTTQAGSSQDPSSTGAPDGAVTAGASPVIPAVDTELDALLNSLLDEL